MPLFQNESKRSYESDFCMKLTTKFIANNRTGALTTDINLFFYDNKLSALVR